MAKTSKTQMYGIRFMKKGTFLIFFDAAKTSAPKVSPAFKARILKDVQKHGVEVMQYKTCQD